MNTAQNIEMARKAGFLTGAMDIGNGQQNPFVTSIGNTFMFELEQFARLVAAHEREACIRACDAVDLIGADDCIVAIRARGEL